MCIIWKTFWNAVSASSVETWTNSELQKGLTWCVERMTKYDLTSIDYLSAHFYTLLANAPFFMKTLQGQKSSINRHAHLEFNNYDQELGTLIISKCDKSYLLNSSHHLLCKARPKCNLGFLLSVREQYYANEVIKDESLESLWWHFDPIAEANGWLWLPRARRKWGCLRIAFRFQEHSRQYRRRVHLWWSTLWLLCWCGQRVSNLPHLLPCDLCWWRRRNVQMELHLPQRHHFRPGKYCNE